MTVEGARSQAHMRAPSCISPIRLDSFLGTGKGCGQLVWPAAHALSSSPLFLHKLSLCSENYFYLSMLGCSAGHCWFLLNSWRIVENRDYALYLRRGLLCHRLLCNCSSSSRRRLQAVTACAVRGKESFPLLCSACHTSTGDERVITQQLKFGTKLWVIDRPAGVRDRNKQPLSNFRCKIAALPCLEAQPRTGPSHPN